MYCAAREVQPPVLRDKGQPRQESKRRGLHLFDEEGAETRVRLQAWRPDPRDQDAGLLPELPDLLVLPEQVGEVRKRLDRRLYRAGQPSMRRRTA